MKTPFHLVLVPVLAVGGCSQSSQPSASPDGGASILLTNQSNYHSTGSLSLPSVETASGADLDICWGQIASDMQCHAVNPQTDIDNVAFLRLLHLSEAEAQAKLVSGEIEQSQVDGYLEFPTAKATTCARLSQFSFLGTKVDVLAEYQQSADESYLLLFTHGVQRGVGARVMMFLKPTAASTNTKVDAPSGCGQLTFAADLSSPDRVPVPAQAPWIVDWRRVTRDGQGAEIIYSSLDKLLLGYYEGASASDIQSKFFDLELMATSIWDLSLTGGYTADLSQAIDRKTGAAFVGFTANSGVWLLALMCSTCQNPAPVILSILEPGRGAP